MKSVIIIGSDEYSKYLKENLKKLNYKTYYASFPKQGLDKARQKRPDIFIINLESRGCFIIFDIIKEIKSDTRLKNSVIIVLSQSSNDFDKTMSLELGADDYITKPASLPEILAKIKCYLRHKMKNNLSCNHKLPLI